MSSLWSSETEKTVYVHMQGLGPVRGFGAMRNALYAFDIPSTFELPSPDELKSVIDNPPCVSPIIVFSYPVFPLGMSCAVLNSKFYFLGGEFCNIVADPLDGFPDFYDYVPYHYPADVYVFDIQKIKSGSGKLDAANELNSSSSLLMKTTSMKSGKPLPLAFTFDGKLYALASQVNSMNAKLMPDEVTFFEMYDPSTREWTTLPDPPFAGSDVWRRGGIQGHSILHRKINVFTKMGPSEAGIFCFDFDKMEWIYSFSIPTLSDEEFFNSNPVFVGDRLYGCNRFYGLQQLMVSPPVKKDLKTFFSGPANFDLKTFFYVPGYTYFSEAEKLNFFKQVPMTYSSSHLLHLGDRIFCHVSRGIPISKDDLPYCDRSPVYVHGPPDLSSHDGPPDSHCYLKPPASLFSINIFKLEDDCLQCLYSAPLAQDSSIVSGALCGVFCLSRSDFIQLKNKKQKTTIEQDNLIQSHTSVCTTTRQVEECKELVGVAMSMDL